MGSSANRSERHKKIETFLTWIRSMWSFTKTNEEKPQEERPASVSLIPRPSLTPSILGSNLTVKGTLTSTGYVHLNGPLVGDTRAKVVVIGEGATIQGAVIGDEVSIYGRVHGIICART